MCVLTCWYKSQKFCFFSCCKFTKIKDRHACTKLILQFKKNFLFSNHSRRKANKKLTLGARLFCWVRFTNGETWVCAFTFETFSWVFNIFSVGVCLWMWFVVRLFSKQKFLGFFFFSQICILLSRIENVRTNFGLNLATLCFKNTRLVCLFVSVCVCVFGIGFCSVFVCWWARQIWARASTHSMALLH